MPRYKRLVGAKCYLSPVSQEDAEGWTKWDNDLDVAVPLGSEACTPVSIEKSREWIDLAIKKQDPIFSIIDLETDRLIGRVLLFGVSQIDRQANIGIVIGEKDYWDRGYGAEALSLMLDHAFNALNLNSVMLGTFDYNERAIACYRKLGFKLIGRRRQARILGERKYDLVLMDLLAEEFRASHPSRFVAVAEEGRGPG
jgi:RimJ/RimL family protein N-acetyltransferase